MFSYEFCKIYKNNYFVEQLPTAEEGKHDQAINWNNFIVYQKWRQQETNKENKFKADQLTLFTNVISFAHSSYFT